MCFTERNIEILIEPWQPQGNCIWLWSQTMWREWIEHRHGKHGRGRGTEALYGRVFNRMGFSTKQQQMSELTSRWLQPLGSNYKRQFHSRSEGRLFFTNCKNAVLCTVQQTLFEKYKWPEHISVVHLQINYVLGYTQTHRIFKKPVSSLFLFKRADANTQYIN